jgi:WD40 repeat protein
VWHLAPDQVFYRERAGEPSWLAVCACGMTGTPEAIGWMGDRCGCCHYKPAEAPAETPVHFATFRDAKHALKQLAFSPDGRWLAGAGPGNAVHLWNVAEGRYHGLALSRAGATLALTFTPDSCLIAIASTDRLLHFVGIPTGEEVSAYPTPQGVSSVTIAPDNLTLAIGAKGALEIWGRPEGGLPWLPVYELHSMVSGAAFNQRGDLLAVGFDPEVMVLGIMERAGWPHPYRAWGTPGQPHSLAFCADGRNLVVIHQHREPAKPGVASWDLDRRLDSYSHSLHSRSTAYAISPDVQWLAGIQANSVEIESVRDRGRWFLLLGQRPFTALAFSPDGHTLATADRDGAVKLWPWRRLIEV